jgi:hypothetical protein
MKRPRIITRRVALVVRFSDVCGIAFTDCLPERDFTACMVAPLWFVSYVRTRVRVCARPTGAGARVVSLGPLSGNS